MRRKRGNARGVSRSAKSTTPAAPRLTPKQHRFFDAARHNASIGKGFIQRDIATLAGISETIVSRWMQLDWFVDLVAQFIRKGHGPAIEAMHAGQIQNAARFLPSYLAQLRRLGIETPYDDPRFAQELDRPGAGSGVHFHVHGIPEREPFESLPPPHALPAASAAPVPPAK